MIHQAVFTLLVSITVLSAAPPRPAEAGATFADISLGRSVLETVRAYGPPDLVQTVDEGHEWRWYDARGIDRDVLTDDDLNVIQILAARPENFPGKRVFAQVQPHEIPALGLEAGAAGRLLARLGATALPQPNPEAWVWRMPGYIVVCQLQRGRVEKILALDIAAAARLGYLPGGSPALRHRAPLLESLHAVGYPHGAIENRSEGVVVVRVSLDAAGKVREARVIVSSGNTEIDAAETESMSRSSFSPARCAGNPCDGIYLDREEYELSR